MHKLSCAVKYSESSEIKSISNVIDINEKGIIILPRDGNLGSFLLISF